MEKRLLLAMVLCLLILLVYQSYVEKQNERWKAMQEDLEEQQPQAIPSEVDPLQPIMPVETQARPEGFQKEEGEAASQLEEASCSAPMP